MVSSPVRDAETWLWLRQLRWAAPPRRRTQPMTGTFRVASITKPRETNGARLSTLYLRQLGLTSARAVRRVYKNFSCHRWATALAPGNNERPARCFVSSVAMQQRPLSMRPWWHPINIRKYGLWAGGYCSRWRSLDNIFTDKCLSTEINIVPCSAQANSMALCETPNSSGPRREPTPPPPLRCGCGLLS